MLEDKYSMFRRLCGTDAWLWEPHRELFVFRKLRFSEWNVYVSEEAGVQ